MLQKCRKMLETAQLFYEDVELRRYGEFAPPGALEKMISEMLMPASYYQLRETIANIDSLLCQQRDLPELPLNSQWQHPNGTIYTILFLANLDVQHDAYPTTVVYQDDKGKIWSRPVASWFTTAWKRLPTPIHRRKGECHVN